SQLNHKNFVPIRDSGEAEGHLYFTMEFVDGRTLRALLREPERLPLDTVCDFGIQVLEFLDHLHARGYIHRDLKPENLMIVEERGAQVVRVLDLGIAKPRASEQDLGLTGDQAPGTLQYMSPENLRHSHL